MPGNNFLWPKVLYSESSFPSGRAVHVGPWVVLSVCFLPVEFGVSDSPLLFHPPCLPFIPGSQCFCWCNILRYYGSSMQGTGFIQLDKSLFHRYPLDHLTSILDFCWDDCRFLGIICIISSRSPLCDWILWPLVLLRTKKGSRHTFFSRTCILDGEHFNILILSSFAVQIGWEFLNSSRLYSVL